MILSDHAIQAMEDDNIREEEIRWCLEHGRDEIDIIIEGERRYGKILRQKQRDLFVIYTHTDQGPRIITAFTVKRRKQWY